MFGFRGGETADTVARKRAYMRTAQARWPFLTHFDAATIKNPRPLVSLVRDRCSLSVSDAESQVEDWMEKKEFGDLADDPLAGSARRPSELCQ